MIFGDKLIFKSNSDNISLVRTFWTLPDLYKLGIDRYKRYIGEGYKRNLNLNSWLVSNGHAVAYRKYSKKYVSDEINAKNKKLGIWQGKFEMPWEYRRKK